MEAKRDVISAKGQWGARIRGSGETEGVLEQFLGKYTEAPSVLGKQGPECSKPIIIVYIPTMKYLSLETPDTSNG